MISTEARAVLSGVIGRSLPWQITVKKNIPGRFSHGFPNRSGADSYRANNVHGEVYWSTTVLSKTRYLRSTAHFKNNLEKSEAHRENSTCLSDPFQQHSNLSKMQSFSYSEQSLLLRYSCTWKRGIRETEWALDSHTCKTAFPDCSKSKEVPETAQKSSFL